MGSLLSASPYSPAQQDCSGFPQKTPRGPLPRCLLPQRFSLSRRRHALCPASVPVKITLILRCASKTTSHIHPETRAGSGPTLGPHSLGHSHSLPFLCPYRHNCHASIPSLPRPLRKGGFVRLFASFHRTLNIPKPQSVPDLSPDSLFPLQHLSALSG